MNPSRERMFNVPAVVLAIIAVLAAVHAYPVPGAVHAGTGERISPACLLSFPARYSSGACRSASRLPGGFGADIWTFVTYAFIHADLSHLTLQLHLAPRLRHARWRVASAQRASWCSSALTAAAGAAAHLASAFRRVLADDRRFGGDFGRDGRRRSDLRSRRAGRSAPSAAAMKPPTTCRRSRLAAACAIRRWSCFCWSGSAPICCSASGHCRSPASTGASPGRRISAAFSSGFLAFAALRSGTAAGPIEPEPERAIDPDRPPERDVTKAKAAMSSQVRGRPCADHEFGYDASTHVAIVRALPRAAAIAVAAIMGGPGTPDNCPRW